MPVVKQVRPKKSAPGGEAKVKKRVKPKVSADDVLNRAKEEEKLEVVAEVDGAEVEDDKQISHAQYIRLCRKAGLTQVRCVEALHQHCQSKLRETIRRAAVLLKYHNAKVLKPRHVIPAFDFHVVGGLNLSKKIKIKDHRRPPVKEKPDNDQPAKKRRRRKIAQSDVRHLQGEEGLIFSKAPFQRMCRQYIHEFCPDASVSPKALHLLQHGIEKHLINVMRQVHAFALHDSRSSASAKDMNLYLFTQKVGDPHRLSCASSPVVDYTNFIRTVAKSFSEEKPRISDDVLTHLSRLLNSIGLIATSGAQFLCSYGFRVVSEKLIVSADDISAALDILVDSKILADANAAGNTAYELYKKSLLENTGAKQTRSSRAGLILPTNRTKMLIQHGSSLKVSTRSFIHLTAMLEYIVLQILTRMNSIRLEGKLSTLNSSHLSKLVSTDTEIAELLRGLGVQMVF